MTAGYTDGLTTDGRLYTRKPGVTRPFLISTTIRRVGGEGDTSGFLFEPGLVEGLNFGMSRSPENLV